MKLPKTIYATYDPTSEIDPATNRPTCLLASEELVADDGDLIGEYRLVRTGTIHCQPEVKWRER